MTIEELGKHCVIIDFGDLFTKSTTNIYYKQGEIGTSSIKARLVKKRTPIDLTGCRVVVNIVSEDGVPIVDNATIVNEKEGIIEINFEQVALKTGISFFELTIISDNYNTKKSPKIAYRVLDSFSEDAIIESEKYPILVNLIAEVDELHVTTQDLINQTNVMKGEVTELNQTVTQAESVRESNETVRQQTHQAMTALKGEVETLKTQTETVKTQTEKVKNDTLTVKNETASVKEATELVRVATEAVKGQTETVKTQTDNVRKATELVKTNTEAVRVATDLVKTQAEEKIVDVENRMQTIETTFDSLVDGTGLATKEYVDSRLDVISANVEGSYITVNDSVEGSIQNIEILGNTIQNESDLSDIKSCGIEQADGHFKMSILSCGKNLFNNKKELGGISSDTGENQSSSNLYRSVDYIKIDGGKNYVFSTSNTNGLHTTFNVYFYDNNKKFLGYKAISKIDTSNIFANACYIRFSKVDTYEWQLEEGTKATQYEPYQSNKCDILLPCPLEKVGDVADRLYYDDVEKAWCIEKKIGQLALNGSENWSISDDTQTNTIHFRTTLLDSLTLSKNNQGICNRFVCQSIYLKDIEGCAIEGSSTNLLRFGILRNKLSSVDANGFKTWLSQNPTLVKYQLATPTKIILPLSTQIQLNSFMGTTHLYLECGDVEGTIKATVPKSLGASVQSLSTKTDILSDRVEAIEGLKDSQNITYQTDKGYLVAEKTVDGVVKDVKVEGRTFNNLFKLVSSGITIVSSANLYGNVDLSYTELTKGKTMTFFNTTGKQVIIDIYESGAWKRAVIVKNTNTKTLITTTSTEYIRAIYGQGKDGWGVTEADKELLKSCMVLLDGDVSSVPFNSHFEGLKSVGQDVDGIEISSNPRYSNLFNSSEIASISKTNVGVANGSDDGNIITLEMNKVTNNYCEAQYRANFIPVIEGERFTIQFNATKIKDTSSISAGGINAIIRFYDSSKKNIVGISDSVYRNSGTNTRGFTVPKGAKYMVLNLGTHINASGEDGTLIQWTIDKSSIIITKGTIVNDNEKYISPHKKQLLYYNELGELKPIPQLREWDSVYEENGKTYYRVGSGEVVLNGSENWMLNGTHSKFIDYTSSKLGIKNSICMSDKISLHLGMASANTKNPIGIRPITNGIRLKPFEKDDMTLEEGKAWLQTNPITVVYELETPIVYECPNLNLSSYSDETMISLNSGAINPSMEFSITSHINELVKNNQSRINELEERIMNMFKSVLSGDMQSLAYSLYPQDFESDNENEIELLPVE